MTDCLVTIIGGGIIGTAIAYELCSTMGDEPICLLERNTSFPGENQTSRNSGVIHAGIYYSLSTTPLKARLCVEGNKQLYEFCRNYNLPAKQSGKLVVATNPAEDKSLDDLLLQAQANGVPGVEKISSGQARELEPNLYAYSALSVPTSGIVEPTSVLRKLRELSQVKEYFLLGTTVEEIIPQTEEFILKVSSQGTRRSEFSTKYVINAAGLYGDEVAKMVNPDFPLTIFPVRGETAKFYQSREDLHIKRNIYPVPVFYDKPDLTKHLTLGVHLTPTFSLDREGNFTQEQGAFMLGKEVTVGPLNRKRGEEVTKEDYGTDLAAPTAFRNEIKKYFPGIRVNDLQLHQTGIQAVLSNSADFHIAPDQKYPHLINVVGISSPGLTASLAIAKYVRNILKLVNNRT